ncbi:hypothetical protein [uncultured Rhodoblastus sp.]|uniref:hypothetical protein n=1 Tax=uncultured Rhodoblastus sp. TaxID=543037 RepID=UPI0025DDE38E|nr:hypothetical protein [uncultured Rhodoblastus sp.]
MSTPAGVKFDLMIAHLTAIPADRPSDEVEVLMIEGVGAQSPLSARLVIHRKPIKADAT